MLFNVGAFVGGCAASAVAGAILGATAMGLYKQHEIDGLAVAAAHQEAVVKELARRQVKSQVELSDRTGAAEAVAQVQIETRTRTIIKEVPVYVTASQDASSCVSYGLVLVLDAAAQGLDPSQLDLAPGQSADACAPVKASDLARSVAENYGVARQNAQQLDALAKDIRERVDIANGGGHPADLKN